MAAASAPTADPKCVHPPPLNNLVARAERLIQEHNSGVVCGHDLRKAVAKHASALAAAPAGPSTDAKKARNNASSNLSHTVGLAESASARSAADAKASALRIADEQALHEKYEQFIENSMTPLEKQHMTFNYFQARAVLNETGYFQCAPSALEDAEATLRPLIGVSSSLVYGFVLESIVMDRDTSLRVHRQGKLLLHLRFELLQRPEGKQLWAEDTAEIKRAVEATLTLAAQRLATGLHHPADTDECPVVDIGLSPINVDLADDGGLAVALGPFDETPGSYTGSRLLLSRAPGYYFESMVGERCGMFVIDPGLAEKAKIGRRAAAKEVLKERAAAKKERAAAKAALRAEQRLPPPPPATEHVAEVDEQAASALACKRNKERLGPEAYRFVKNVLG